MRLLRKVFYPELPLHFPTRVQAISKTFQTEILRKQGLSSVSPERTPGRKGVTKRAGWTVCYALRKSYENASPPPVKTGAEAKVWKGGGRNESWLVWTYGQTRRERRKGQFNGVVPIYSKPFAPEISGNTTQKRREGRCGTNGKIAPLFSRPLPPSYATFLLFCTRVVPSLFKHVVQLCCYCYQV